MSRRHTSEMSESRSEDLKFFLANQAQSFAEPLLSILLDQKTADPLGTSRCRQELVQVSSAALKNQEWALKMFDSSGRLQSGLASGSLYNLLGSYDQCLASQNRTSFCLAHVAAFGWRFELPFEEYNTRAGQQSAVKFGFCAPASCNTNNITLIARHLFNSSRWLRSLSLLNVECHPQQQQQDSLLFGWRISSIVSILLLLVTIVGSIMSTRKSATTTSNNNNNNKWLLDTFSIRRTANKLMQKRKQLKSPLVGEHEHKHRHRQQPQTVVLDGLKVISTIWIIIIHSYNFAFQWLAFDNHFRVQNVYQSIWLQWIANGTFSIDNFFIISGFLAYLKQQQQQQPPPQQDSGQLRIAPITRRYLRLVPTMLVVILLSVALFPSLNWLSFNMANTSPMFSDWCEKNWFLNALLLQNWIRTPNQCFGHTWFVAADFQLMLVMQFVLFVCSQVACSKGARMLVLSVCLIASQVLSATLVYTNQLQPMPVIPAESVDKLNEYFRLVYIKPYYWLSSYTIGMLLAMLVVRDKHVSNEASSRRRKMIHHDLIASVMPILVICLILFSLFPYFFHSRMSNLQSSLYVLFARPLWSLSVGSLLYQLIRQPANTHRDNLVIKTLRAILGARVWLPLSRLSYLAYLLHPALMAIFYGSATSPIRYSSPLFLYFSVGNIVLTFGAAFVFYLFLEIPLQTILLKAANKIVCLDFPPLAQQKQQQQQLTIRQSLTLTLRRKGQTMSN